MATGPEDDKAARAAELTMALNQADYQYFILDRPQISDEQYDAMKRELQQLEEAHPELRLPNSPVGRVGPEPKWYR